MKITVCGAGPGGKGMAVFLMSRGHEVSLYDMPAYGARLSALKEDPALTSRDFLEYAGKLAGVYDQPEPALRDAEAVYIVTHAAAHKMLAELFAPYVRRGQLIVMCPGYVGGGMEFLQNLKPVSGASKPQYIEASSFPLLSRNEGEHNLQIAGCKRGFYLYVPDELDGNPAVLEFQKMFAPVKVCRHPLEPGLNEINVIVHAVVTLLNAARVEKGEPWRFYRDGLSPAIMGVVEQIDAERCALQEALNLEPHPLTCLLDDFYADQGMRGNNLYEQLTGFSPFEKVPGPLTFSHRFITEDAAYGLAPMGLLGRKSGLEMPVTNLMLGLAQVLTGTDFLLAGRQIY